MDERIREIEEEITYISSFLTGDKEADEETWKLLDELYEELADVQYQM